MNATTGSVKAIRDLYAAAYHEAGHAVAHVLTRRGIREVRLEDDSPDRSGVCLPTARPWPRRPSQRTCEEMIIRDFAGPVAEAIFCGYEHSALFVWGSGPGLAGAKQDLNHAITIEIRHREHDLRLDALWVRTCALLTATWPAVEALAEELLFREGAPIPGKNARHVITASLPPGSLPGTIERKLHVDPAQSTARRSSRAGRHVDPDRKAGQDLHRHVEQADDEARDLHPASDGPEDPEGEVTARRGAPQEARRHGP